MPSYIRTRSEFALNSYTAGDQVGGSVATFADGGFIVVWITMDPTQDGDDQAIKAQRFDSTGAKVGPEFLVNSFASGAQFSAEVATLPNGSFVVTWVTNISDDGTDGIKAQLFNASGQPIGAEFQVNLDSGFTFTSNVSALANGGFVISWDDWNGFDMKAQMFDGNGARVGGVITVNSRTTYAQEYGDIVGLAGGGFVATWRTTDTSDDGSGHAVKAQVFDAGGAKVGTEFLVNSQKAGHQYGSTVEALAGGGFVVLWESWDAAQDGSSSALKGQIFSASGAKVGAEFRVNTQGMDMQRDPQAAGTPDGGFVVTWTDFSSTSDGSQSSIKAQAFDSTGAKVGGEMLINTMTAGYQTVGGIETLADGRLILTWTTDGGDGDGRSIRGQILGTQVAPTLPNTAPLIISNGGGAAASFNVDEGTTAVTRVVGSDDGEPTALRYSITGGEDASAFRINALTGVLEFYSTADHVEGGDNLYDVIVSVSDGQLTDSQQMSVSVAHVNYITIESNGGGNWAELWVDENTTAVTTVWAVDDDGLQLTYSISGDHAEYFTIDAQTGELSFTVAPDYETPVNWQNVFFVTVSATDGTRSDSQELAVYVNDVAEFGIVYDGGEGPYGEIYVPENGTAVTTLGVIGAAGPVTYEIVGGYEASWFEIDPETGALSFVAPPDYETGTYAPYTPPYYDNPEYYNLYNVIVRASDGVSVDEQELYVRVEDVEEAPVFISYAGQAEVALSIGESTLPTLDVTAADPDRYSWVSYTLEGADAALFEIDPYNGRLSLRQELDHEAPIDADGDNVYEVSVIAYSGGLSATQSFAITVENGWEAVTITSHGDTSVATVPTPENRLAVTTFTASGDGPIYYEIAGGADASWFAIDPHTGELSFLYAPNYEGQKERGHGSTGHGNSYDVIVRATNGYSYDEQRLSVRVQDVDEAPRLFSYAGQADVALLLDENVQAAATVRASDPDRAATVTYGIAGGADASLFEVDPSSGAVRFRQSADFEAPADSDGDNVYEVAVAAYSTTMSVTQSLSITIGDVDENVAIISDGRGDTATVSVAENGTAVTTVAAESGLAVTYSIVGGADSTAFTIDASTGALAFASAPDFESTVDSDQDNVFQVIVQASNGMNSDDQHISVALTNVDENPDFFDHETGVIATWADENRAFVGIYRAHDIDGGAEIVHSVTGGADGALFVIDPATGELSFVAAAGPDFEAPADSDGDNVYEVEITASQGAWSQARTFTVTVGNENEQPRITSDGGGTSAAIELDEGRTAVTTVTSVDDGPDPVTYSITGGPDSALFAIDAASGALSFIAAPDYEGPFGDSTGSYTVEVTASDGQLSTSQSIQIVVRDVEEVVTITSGAAVSMDEETGFVTRILATDGDADPISWSIVGGADSAHFLIDPGTGDLTARTLLDFEAPADSDGDNVYEVTVRASDGRFTDDRQMSITVEDVDDDIEIVSFGGADLVSFSMEENSSFYVADVDANMSSFFGVTFSIGGGADADRFRIDPDSGMLSFAYPFAPDYEAPGDSDGDNVYDVVVVANRLTTSDSQAFAITIANRNESLSITSPDGWQPILAIDEGNRVVTTVVAVDRDGDVPTYSIAGGADSALFAIDSATGALTFIAAPDYETPRSAAGTNSYIVEVGATDGQFRDLQTIRIQIGNVNEAPVITSGGGGNAAAVTVNENGLAVTNITAGDADGNPLTYSISGGADASSFTIESGSGILRFVQAPNFEAPGDAGGDNVYDVIVSVTDGVLTDSQAVAVTVANLAEIVAITSNGGGAGGSVAAAENGTTVTTVTASNPDGGTVTYAIAGGADSARFTINASTGILAFVAAPNFEAPADAGANNVYDVVVSASNGATTDTQALAVAVGNVDEQMTIASNGGGASASVSVNENATVVTTVVGVDPDGAPVSYAILDGGDSALFTINSTTGLLSFRAAPNFEAPADSDRDNVYNVVVTASDGHWSDSQAIAVTIANLAEAPVITSNGGGASGAVSVAENGVAVAVVAAADPEGVAVTYSIAGGADAARFAINAQTGALHFIAAPDWELPADSNQDNVYAVVVRASDGQLVDDQTLNVTVTNLRDGNTVTGTSGGDSISATSTNTALRTSNEEDVVFGRDGHDTIHGMAGDDEIYGEAGNDTLVGGGGADKLTGGFGKDQFTYNAVSDSTGASRDVITDFSRSQGDKISLSAIDANSLASLNQAFTFIGTSAFSNVAGQLRYETSGGMTTIFGDVNGDGLADLQIQLSGSIPLISSDFIL
jgi:hypothetical protein